jgi:hypothetical protein
LSAFSSHLIALNIPVLGFDLESIPHGVCQVVKQSTSYFETARNPNCASKGKESEKVTALGVVASYDSGGTTVIVYSCSIQSPGDQIKMLNQPSPLLEGSGSHFPANMPCSWNLTPSSGGSDTSHRPSPLRSCQAATRNDMKQSDKTSGVEVGSDVGVGSGVGGSIPHALKNSTTIVTWMVDVIFLVFTFFLSCLTQAAQRGAWLMLPTEQLISLFCRFCSKIQAPSTDTAKFYRPGHHYSSGR